MRKEEQSSGISIVVPFLNESEGIELFCTTLDAHAETLSFPVELVFVDDGSTDDTVEKLTGFSFQHVANAKVIRFSKNYGSHAAIRAGFLYASYDICTWMGSDLQEPLEFLAETWQKIQEGYDAVYIEKRTVGVSAGNRAFSKIYSHLMQKYAVSSYSSGGISVIVINRKIRDYLNANVEGNSSIMLQIMDAGFRYCTLSMDFHERATGVSKWTLKKKIKLFIDSFVAFSFMPIRLVSIVGVVLFLLGIVIGVGAIINKIVTPQAPMGYTTLICLLALGFGVTNIALGIIAEYLWRTYDAARKRPVFLISEEIDLSAQPVETRESGAD